MRVELTIFIVLFLLQGLLYIKVKKELRKSNRFFEISKEFIELYATYIKLRTEQKIGRKSTVDLFFREKFEMVDVLLNCSSFDKLISVPNPNKKMNEGQIKKLLTDIKNSDSEVLKLFNRTMEVDINLFKSVRVQLKNGFKISGNLYFQFFRLKFLLKIILDTTQKSGNQKQENEITKQEKVAIHLLNKKQPIGACLV